MNKGNFNDFQLSSELLKAISLLNFISPSKVQEQVIPAVLAQKDIIVKSQTGKAHGDGSLERHMGTVLLCQIRIWEKGRRGVKEC